MRLSVAVIFSLWMLCALSAHATPVSRDQANAYYKTCMAQPQVSIKPDSLATLCACTSARVMETMTSEDLALAGNNALETKPLRHRMLTDIYAPCTETIAADLIDVQCVNNRKLDGLQTNFDIGAVCDCAAQTGATWYQGKSQIMMREALKKNPDVTDPAQALLEHPQMKSRILNDIVSCDAIKMLIDEPSDAAATP